jgi:hypothetical protein
MILKKNKVVSNLLKGYPETIYQRKLWRILQELKAP